MASDAASKALSAGFMLDTFHPPNGGNPVTEGKEPVLQVLKLAQMNQDKSKWRAVFSDGTHVVQGLLSSQCSPMVEQGLVRETCLVRFKHFQVSKLKDSWIFVVLQFEVLDEFGEVGKIGNPKPMGGKKEEQDQSTAAAPGPMTGQGFYGNNVKRESSSKPSLPSRSVAHSHRGTIFPIESISPYGSGWTIKARVTSKSPIKEWHNDRGSGKLFSFNLLDESGEIRATAFNNQCDSYYEMIEEGGVYYLSHPCTVKMAQKKFNNLNNDYELTLETGTMIEKAEDQQDVPQVKYNFTPISDLAEVEKDAVVDTIGILREVGEVNQITSKSTGKPYYKRDLTIVDDTCFSIKLTIWGSAANDFNVPVEDVVAFKGAKVSDFNVRSLSLLSSGTLMANPDVDESHRLKGWYQAAGRAENFNTHNNSRVAGAGPARSAPSKTIEQVKSEGIGMKGEAEYFDLKATTSFFNTGNTFCYTACASPEEKKCNKKVIEDSDGTWRCDACGFVSQEPLYRYVLNFSVSDHTGQLRVNCFDEIGRKIVGMDAKALIETKNQGSAEEQQAWAGATWNTFMLRCRAQLDTYQDEERVRYTVVSVSPVDYVRESAKLAELISSYG